MRIDHVIYGTSDLDAASARFEAAGLQVEPGGAHEGIGTHNRIVPLGADYVEVLAILDAAMAAESPIGRLIAERIGASQLEVRRRGTGHIVGLPEALADGFLPFFIQREPKAGPGGLERIEVAGDRRRLADWLGGAALPVKVVAGPPGLRAVTIRGRRL